jgi:FtsH-binding integral membrane protein
MKDQLIIFAQQTLDADKVGLPDVAADDNQLRNGLAIAFGVAAALAVLTIVIAALNFASAGSDKDKIGRSKNAIIFALIGLMIALTAEAIVLTVLDKV